MKIPRELQHRPAVHQLCFGAFTQEMLPIGEHVTVVPLQPLGFDVQAKYTAQYAKEVVSAQVDGVALAALKKQGNGSLPILAIVVRNRIDVSARELERLSESYFARAQMLIAWLSGELPEPFAIVTVTRKLSLECFQIKVVDVSDWVLEIQAKIYERSFIESLSSQNQTRGLPLPFQCLKMP